MGTALFVAVAAAWLLLLSSLSSLSFFLPLVACDDYVLIVTNKTFAGNFQNTSIYAGGIDGICQGPNGGNSPIWKGFLQDGSAAGFHLGIPDGVNNSFYNINHDLIVANVTMSDFYNGLESVGNVNEPLTLEGSFPQFVDDGAKIWTGSTTDGHDCDNFTSISGSDCAGVANCFISLCCMFNANNGNCDTQALLYCYAPLACVTGDKDCTATVSGDPHFVGFNGCKYNFGGVDGSVYAIYSDVDLQVNAQLGKLAVRGVDGTWMTKVGIRTVDAVVVFDPSEGLLNAEDLTLIVPGESVAFSTSKIQMKVNENDGRIDEMTMVTPHARIRVEVKRFGNGPRDFFLNIDFVLLAPPVSPHGVLGQTARALGENAAAADSEDCSRPVAGSEEDYLVRDGIVGTDFVFQQYQTSVSLEVRSRLEQPFVGSANWDI